MVGLVNSAGRDSGLECDPKKTKKKKKKKKKKSPEYRVQKG
jgi:hypothetical protein